MHHLNNWKFPCRPSLDTDHERSPENAAWVLLLGLSHEPWAVGLAVPPFWSQAIREGPECCLSQSPSAAVVLGFHNVALGHHKAQGGDLAEAGVAARGGTCWEHPWPCVPVLGRGLCFNSCL